MKIVSVKATVALLFLLFGCAHNSKENNHVVVSEDEIKIRQVHENYVEGWKASDEEKVMDLLEEEAQIQPNRFNPVIGKENIRDFWFPKDSSQTIINEFTTNIIFFEQKDTIAITTHSTVLDWDYRKDSTAFGMYQEGYNTTIYRKQEDASWKIWRSMWTDLIVKRK